MLRFTSTVSTACIAFFVAAAASAIDFGWQELPGGGVEYLVQVEPELIGTFQQEGFSSELPAGLKDVRRVRITVGKSALPHQGELAASKSADAEIESEKEPLPVGRIETGARLPSVLRLPPPPSDPRLFPDRPSSQWPTAASAGSSLVPLANNNFANNGFANNANDNRYGNNQPPQLLNANSGNQFDTRGNQYTGTQPNNNYNNGNWNDNRYPNDNRFDDNRNVDNRYADNRFGNWANDPSRSQWPTTDVTRGEMPRESYTTAPRGNAFDSTAARPGAIDNTQARVLPTVAPPVDKPWTPFMLALMALFTSIGVNVYLVWIHQAVRLKYQSLVLRGDRRAALGV